MGWALVEQSSNSFTDNDEAILSQAKASAGDTTPKLIRHTLYTHISQDVSTKVSSFLKCMCTCDHGHNFKM